MSKEFTNELDKFENLLLDWMRTVAIFFIVAIALYHFTPYGKIFTILMFMISIIVMITMIVDYMYRREQLEDESDVRLSLDVLVAAMLLALALVVIMTVTVIVLPRPKLDDLEPITEHFHFP